jgi:hypothetical protein
MQEVRVTPVRVRPLWRATACAVLLAVGLVTPHLAGHEEARLRASGERALLALTLDGAGARPLPCLLCLAGTQLRDSLRRVAAAPLPAAGLELPLVLDHALRQACVRFDRHGVAGCQFAVALVEEGGALQALLER